MSKYRNIKVHVPTPEISEAVQKKLFEDGGFWAEGGTDLKGATYPYLYVSYEGEMSYGKLKEIFFGAEHDAVHYQSILDPYYDVKIAWANKKPIQYSKDGKRWMDWGFRYLLDIRDDEIEWRVKPRLKIHKQWERKFWDGKNVNMARSTDENPDWDVGLEWINEPELKEYEVPND